MIILGVILLVSLVVGAGLIVAWVEIFEQICKEKQRNEALGDPEDVRMEVKWVNGKKSENVSVSPAHG